MQVLPFQKVTKKYSIGDKSYNLYAIGIVALQIVGGWVGTLALCLNVVFACSIVMKWDVRYYGSLLILLLPSIALRNASSFTTEGLFRINQYGEAAWLFLPIKSMVNVVTFASFDIYTPFLISVITTALILRRFFSDKNNESSSVNIMLGLWVVSLSIAFYAAVHFYITQSNTVILGIKMLLGLSGFFWGLLITHRSKANANLMVQYLTNWTFAALLLFLLGGVHNQLFLILPGFAGALSILFLKRAKFIQCFLCVLIGIIFLTRFTFTTSFSFLLGSFIATVFLYPGIFSPIKKIFTKSRFLLASLTVLFPLVTFQLVHRSEGYSSSNVIIQRLIEKAFADRYNVWKGAWDLVAQPPHFIVPSGRNIFIAHYEHGHILEVSFGAHNLALEAIRQLGWISGTIAVLIVAYIILTCIRLLWFTKNPLLISLLSGFVASTLMATTTGHFLASDRIGFFVWSLAGVLVGLGSKSYTEVTNTIENRNRQLDIPQY